MWIWAPADDGSSPRPGRRDCRLAAAAADMVPGVGLSGDVMRVVRRSGLDCSRAEAPGAATPPPPPPALDRGESSHDESKKKTSDTKQTNKNQCTRTRASCTSS